MAADSKKCLSNLVPLLRKNQQFIFPFGYIEIVNYLSDIVEFHNLQLALGSYRLQTASNNHFLRTMQTICSYFRHHIIRHTLQLCNNGRRSHNYRGQLFDRLFGTLRMSCGRHIFHSHLVSRRLKTRPDFDEFMNFFQNSKNTKVV